MTHRLQLVFTTPSPPNPAIVRVRSGLQGYRISHQASRLPAVHVLLVGRVRGGLHTAMYSTASPPTTTELLAAIVITPIAFAVALATCITLKLAMPKIAPVIACRMGNPVTRRSATPPSPFTRSMPSRCAFCQGSLREYERGAASVQGSSRAKREAETSHEAAYGGKTGSRKMSSATFRPCERDVSAWTINPLSSRAGAKQKTERPAMAQIEAVTRFRLEGLPAPVSLLFG